jgi:hypothetical protein
MRKHCKLRGTLLLQYVDYLTNITCTCRSALPSEYSCTINKIEGVRRLSTFATSLKDNKVVRFIRHPLERNKKRCSIKSMKTGDRNIDKRKMGLVTRKVNIMLLSVSASLLIFAATVVYAEPSDNASFMQSQRARRTIADNMMFRQEKSPRNDSDHRQRRDNSVCSCSSITPAICASCLDLNECDEEEYICSKDCCRAIVTPTATPTNYDKPQHQQTTNTRMSYHANASAIRDRFSSNLKKGQSKYKYKASKSKTGKKSKTGNTWSSSSSSSWSTSWSSSSDGQYDDSSDDDEDEEKGEKKNGKVTWYKFFSGRKRVASSDTGETNAPTKSPTNPKPTTNVTTENDDNANAPKDNPTDINPEPNTGIWWAFVVGSGIIGIVAGAATVVMHRRKVSSFFVSTYKHGHYYSEFSY